ncbi:transforming growth factor-beta receptor type 3-like protein [Pelobates fuscus]|uniref:transforming growth factor-beta receptor type 3-like protein n=1 Tax=Pelobates fuscus TaxID=191477 RepID=UPI002FE44F9B
MEERWDIRGSSQFHIINVFFLLFSCHPPWFNFDVPRGLTWEQRLQTPPSTPLPVTCNHGKKDELLQGSKPPCITHGALERALRAAVRLQVRGPEVQCERGGVCSVSVGSRVQVEVSLSSSSPSLGISLSQCSLSPSSDPFNNSHLPLLVGGCPVEVGVTLQLNPSLPCSKDVPVRSFSFLLGPFYNNSIQFLHCRVGVCLLETFCRGMKRVGSSALPKCSIPHNSCASITPSSSFAKSLFLRTVTQPLIVTIPSPYSVFYPNIVPRKSFRSPHPTPAEQRGQGIGMEAVAGVTLCSFVIGVMLSAGLWYIQSKTAPVSSATNGGSQGLQSSPNCVSTN